VTPASPETIDVPRDSTAGRALRNRRTVLVIVAILSFVATHWPRLVLGTGGTSIDKLAHATNLAVLTTLFWQAGLVRRIPIAFGVMLLWSTFDELSQGIPGLGRTVDFDDWLGNLAGIAMSLAFVAALRPAGTGIAALAAARRRCALDSLLAHWSAWLNLATAAALGAAVGAPLGVLLDSWFVRKGPQPWQYGFVGAVLGAGVVAHAVLEAGIRSRLRRSHGERPCLACASPQADAPPDAPCRTCGAARHARDWASPIGLPGSEELRLCVMPVLLGVAAIIVFNFSAIAILTSLRLRSELVLRFDTWFTALPPDERILADVAGVALIGAWTLSRCRARIAAEVDRGGERCLGCGFDLRATAAGAGAGTCPECGEQFVRIGPG
jgi:hypothetical protein